MEQGLPGDPQGQKVMPGVTGWGGDRQQAPNPLCYSQEAFVLTLAVCYQVAVHAHLGGRELARAVPPVPLQSQAQPVPEVCLGHFPPLGLCVGHFCFPDGFSLLLHSWNMPPFPPAAPLASSQRGLPKGLGTHHSGRQVITERVGTGAAAFRKWLWPLFHR